MKESNIFLHELKDGAVQELFAHELKRVMANIGDPNTAAEVKRQVVITVDVRPNKSRSAADLDIRVHSKLAPALPIETGMIITAQGDELIGREPRQEKMFDNPGAN